MKKFSRNSPAVYSMTIGIVVTHLKDSVIISQQHYKAFSSNFAVVIIVMKLKIKMVIMRNINKPY